MKTLLALLIAHGAQTAFAQSRLSTDHALFFLSPCLSQAAGALNPQFEHLSLEKGEYSETSDFTITYAIFQSDMDGYKVNRRLLVHGKHDPHPPADASDLSYKCEIQEN